MMDEDALLRGWMAKKLERAFRRISAPAAVEFEYRRQFGHPSSYAYVRLEATPADQLSFESTARWPDSVNPDEARDFECAVAEGLIDILFAGFEPCRGCALRLTEVRYDPVGSSYFAFRSAGMQAADRLVQDGTWERVTVPR